MRTEDRSGDKAPVHPLPASGSTGAKVRRAVTEVVILRQLNLVIAAVNLSMLARLLTPEAFGTFAIALAFMTLIEALSDFGLTAYVVKADRIDRDMLARAMALALTVASGITVFGLLILFLIPQEIVSDALGLVFTILFIRLLLRPILLPLEAGLQHRIAFRLIAVTGSVRLLVEGGVAILLALQGFGAAALAWGLLAETAAALVMMLMFAPRGLRVLPKFTGWSSMTAFGWKMTAVKLVPQLNSLGTNGVILASMGTVSLGVFNRAQTLAGLFDRFVLDALRPIILPAMVRTHETESNIAVIYARIVALLSAVCWPVFSAMILLAGPLVTTALGPAWSDAVLPLQMLAVGGLATPLVKASMTLFMTMDRLGAYQRIQHVHLIATLGFGLLGAQHSLAGACLGVALAMWLKAVLVAICVSALTGTKLTGLLASTPRHLMLTGFTLVPLLLLATLPQAIGTALTLGFSIVCCAVGWLVGALVTREPLFNEIGRALRELVNWRKPLIRAERD